MDTHVITLTLCADISDVIMLTDARATFTAGEDLDAPTGGNVKNTVGKVIGHWTLI